MSSHATTIAIGIVWSIAFAFMLSLIMPALAAIAFGVVSLLLITRDVDQDIDECDEHGDCCGGSA